MNAILPIIGAQKPLKGARWSETEIALAIRMRRDEGKAVPQIASALGRTTATVYTQLRKFGVIVQEHRAWDDADLARALDALADGQTYAAAAAAIGRTENELRSKIVYDKIVVPARRLAARVSTSDAVARGDNFTVALRAEIAAEQRPLKELARTFGVSVAALSKLARDVHGRRYRSAAMSDAARARIAHARAAKAARSDHGVLWTADAIARLKAIYDASQGAPELRAVAQAFGSTPRMVDKIARAHGLRELKRARRGLTEEAKHRAAALASQGVLITPAARALGVDIRTLRDYAEQVGIVFSVAERGAFANASMKREKAASAAGSGPKVALAPAGETSPRDAESRRDSATERAERRILMAKARRLARLAAGEERRKAREEARARVKAERELAKRLAEAHAREAKRQAMLACAATRPKKVKPAAPKRTDLAVLIADHIAQKGVTRARLTDVELAVAAIRRRGYGVTREADVYRIDQMTVAAADIFAFAEKRGIKWKERSAA